MDARGGMDELQSGGGLLLDVLDHLPLGVAVLRADDFTFVHTNPVFHQWLPPGTGDVVGLRWSDAFSDGTSAAALGLLRDVARTGESQHHRGIRFRGNPRPGPTLPGGTTEWDWSIYAVRDPRGTITHVISAGLDLTEQAIARERFQRTTSDAVETIVEVSRLVEQRLSREDFFGELSASVARLVGADRVTFWLLQPDGTLAAQRRAFGWPEDALAQMRDVPCSQDGSDLPGQIVHHGRILRAGGDADPLPDTYREVIRDTISVPWLAGDEVLGILGVYDSELETGFSESTIPVVQAAALGAGLVWQAWDAEDRLAAVQSEKAAEYEAHAENLRVLERTKADFLNLASHELRGPLGVLRGYISMCSDGTLGAVPEGMTRVFPILQQKLDEMNRLIDQMLDTARLDDARLDLRIEDVDLGELACSVISSLSPLSKGNMSIEVQRPTAPVLVRGDRARIDVVLTNLVHNAVKYARDGTEVQVVVGRDGDSGRVDVADDGAGIPASAERVLFSRFGRVVSRETSHIPGTGLGLYLSREIARAHGGDVMYQPNTPRGSVFSLLLPLSVG